MTNRLSAIGGAVPTNGAENMIALSFPYVAAVRIRGTVDLLFHRWNCESVEEKSKAAKGSKAKKTDDVESYVYRNADNIICLPGEYLRQAVLHAAKFRQDPRSPRKSAFDLFEAAVVPLTILAPLGKADWDYLHKCRAQVQRNSITRIRPAFMAGWEAEVELQVNLPEYIPQDILHDVVVNAGKLIGVGDNRPTYGRFAVTRFDVRSA